jgi:hypothetical protein
MTRSTKADKARQLNAAHRLLERNTELSEAARLKQPLEIAEATVPITLKLPPRTARRLRAHARSSGLTIGTIVTRALDAFLGAIKRHG